MTRAEMETRIQELEEDNLLHVRHLRLNARNLQLHSQQREQLTDELEATQQHLLDAQQRLAELEKVMTRLLDAQAQLSHTVH